MKILYHHRTTASDGGAVHIEGLSVALRKLGVEVVMVEPRSVRRWVSAKETVEDSDSNSLRQKLPRWLHEVLEVLYNVPEWMRLQAALLRHKPDLIYERNNLYLLSGISAARFARVPIIEEVNAPLYVERSKHGGLALGSLARGSEQWVWKSADAVVAVTHVLADIVAGARVDNRASIEVMPNGIDDETFAAHRIDHEAKRKLGLEGKTVLGFTGFVRDWNGLEHIVDLLPHFRDAVLLVVGDGTARVSLQRRADAAGVGSRVIFTGIVARDAIAPLISAFDVALQPAANPYASPLKLFEYLALGRVVLAPDQPNLREVLTHGENAWLFDRTEHGAMQRSIERLLTDDGLRRRLSEGALATVIERRFTWQHNAVRVLALARALTGQTDAIHPSSTDSPIDHGSDPHFQRYYEQASLSAATLQRFETIRDKSLKLMEARARGPVRLRVADIGCGAGTQSFLWAELGHSVLGLDVNEPLIEVARQRARERALTVDFRVGTATQLPIADASVDVCLLPELLEHVPDWEACLGEAVRVLDSGGLLYVSTTNSLCPRQSEFNLPLYSWYPPPLKRRCERLAATTHPALANYATYPAVNWFTFYRLRNYLAAFGFDCFDRFDTIDSDRASGATRFVAKLARLFPPARLIGHILTPGTALFAIKRKQPANAPVRAGCAAPSHLQQV